MSKYKSDIEIAQEAKLEPVVKIAEKVGLKPEDLELYGEYKAKIKMDVLKRVENNPDSKLILTTAITPTPAGEGKSTVSVGLAQAMNKYIPDKKTVVALREPSLGPCMGIKGGAAGGGYSQIVPMEDINLHFTGDLHAISTAHNVLASILDNHLIKGNELGIDPTKVVFKRVVDLNDRALRNVVIGLGGPAHGVPRESGYMITVASEIMAILCLADGLDDLKERMGNIVIGYTYDDKPVTAKELKVNGAMAALMKDAIKPNLVQTLENTPAFVHGGPFANIAHGCNSVMATKLSMKLSDYTITEAGFGADLGAEKFLDIKCRFANLNPDAIVLVATARALKMHGGVPKDNLKEENLEALAKGLENMDKHIENMQKYGVPVVVAVNAFVTDTPAELKLIKERAQAKGVEAAYCKIWEKGGEGGEELVQAVLKTLEKPSNFKVLYDEKAPIKEKIETIAKEIYGADGVNFTKGAEDNIKALTGYGFDKMPICMAKTQNSISDDPNLLGRPKDFKITVREVYVSAGAGFLVALTGDVMTMPGLPKVPAAEKIDVDSDGKISGLF